MNLIFREEDRPRFEEVKSGIKKIETRAATPKYQKLGVGDEITFTCGEDSFTKTIAKRYHWPSVDAMFAEVPLKNVMPDIDSVEAAKARYASYPGYPEKIKQFGLLGFEFE